jgi:biopolymer transport protein ExbD
MAMSTSNPRGSIAEINITPMADVVIVLLIIMMLAVPFLDHSRVRNLPESIEAQRIGGQVVLSVAVDASLDIGGRGVTLEQLREHLRSVVGAARDSRIQLKVDRELSYSALAPVLAVCQQAGASEIAFVTLPRPGR